MVEASEDTSNRDTIQIDPAMYPMAGDDDILTSEYEHNFTVSNPQDNGGHIVYQTTGIDSQGQWDGKRRFSEFHTLHEILMARWPGIPIPFVPEKKAIGNKDLAFLQDRTFYLQRFLQKLARFKFIIESQEFMLFSRPQGLNIEKSLKGLMPLSTQAKYDRLKEVTNVDETDMDPVQKGLYKNRIQEFQFFVKRVEPILRDKKFGFAHMMRSKQAVNYSYP